MGLKFRARPNLDSGKTDTPEDYLREQHFPVPISVPGFPGQSGIPGIPQDSREIPSPPARMEVPRTRALAYARMYTGCPESDAERLSGPDPRTRTHDTH